VGQPIENHVTEAVEIQADEPPKFMDLDTAVAESRMNLPYLPKDETPGLVTAQHRFIKAQRAFIYNKKLDELAVAQDDYIIALTSVLESSGVLEKIGVL
jgi:hypothetical protein